MKTDVTIIGAGPTGLCLAKALADAGMDVILLERQSRDALAKAAFDGREIALTHESRRLLRQWNIWDQIPSAEISDLKHAKVFDGPNPQYSMNVQAELGRQSQLGWLVPNHLIRRAAYASMSDHTRIQLLDGIKVARVSSNDTAARVHLDDGRTIESRLLVAADSRFSETRRAMGIQALMRDYGKSMMVFRVEHDTPHHHVAWEWFGYGQTRALLPLNGNCASVVLTLPHNQMQQLQNLDDDDFDLDISKRYEFRLGHMRRVSERNVYPLVGVYANSFHAQRFALIGDAAVGMHPVTAHGFNLGVLSIRHLSEKLVRAFSSGQDIGAKSVLERYTRAHRLSTLPLFAATNVVVSLYTADHLPGRMVRSAVLNAASRLTPFKRLVAAQLTG